MRDVDEARCTVHQLRPGSEKTRNRNPGLNPGLY